MAQRYSKLNNCFSFLIEIKTNSLFVSVYISLEIKVLYTHGIFIKLT